MVKREKVFNLLFRWTHIVNGIPNPILKKSWTKAVIKTIITFGNKFKDFQLTDLVCDI